MRKTFIVFSCLFSLLFSSTAFRPVGMEEEFGKAGYYADSLQGRKTASGEKYDKNALTCAHKTLPFGTKVRVTRLDTKKSVIVRVNDRGPFSKGYVVDLSRKAAEQIDLITDGVARVKVDVLEDEDIKPVQHSTENRPAADKSKMTLVKAKTAKKGVAPTQYNTPTATAVDPAPAVVKTPSDLYKVDIKNSDKKGFGVQISTLYDADNVLPIVTKLQAQYPGKVMVGVERDDANNQTTYRVVVGSFGSKEAAEAAQRKLTKTYKRSFVVALSDM
jgi:rare lipoprotein A